MPGRIYILLGFLICFSGGCTDENNLSMDFKISGVKNISVARGERYALPLKVLFLGGEKEKVTINVEGLAAGITGEFDHPTDYPDFELTLTFNVALSFIPGNDTITIIGISESGKIVERTMVLIITDPPNHFPVITLNGSNFIDLTLNDPWLEPGFTATDVEDGDITSQVIVTSSVNNNYMSTYSIKYEVTDSDGYITTRFRTIKVTNSLQSLSGNYSATTTIQGLGVYTWNSYAVVSASPTKNNFLILGRLTECYGLELELEVNGTTLTLPPQSQFGYNTTAGNNGICDSIIHFFSGNGTLTNISTHPKFTINYTDMYKDSVGNASSFYKTDVLIKQ